MMDSMNHTGIIIPIASQSAAAGCGDCLHDEVNGTICRSLLGQSCAAPELSGPRDELTRLMVALGPLLSVPDASRPSGRSSLVRSLHVSPGEVALQLSVAADCGGAALADSAFQALRGLLPDTDIYVDMAS